MFLPYTRARQELGPVDKAEDLLERLDTADQIPQFYLFLNILAEYEKGDESPWFPWLNSSFPRLFISGASMTPYCYECLPPLTASLAMDKQVHSLLQCPQVSGLCQPVAILGDIPFTLLGH